MSSEAHSDVAEHEEHGAHAHPNYVRVWAILLVLLVVSVVGPMFGIRLLTLATAFGIAIVKAYLVAKNFMHLNIEKRFVVYLMVTCLALMFIFFFGASPDVMKHWGANWENRSASNMSAAILKTEEHFEEYEAEHGGAPHAEKAGEAKPGEATEAAGEKK